MKKFALLSLIACIFSNNLCAMNSRSASRANSCSEDTFTTQAIATISQKAKVVKKLAQTINSNVYNRPAISEFLKRNDSITQDMEIFIIEMDRKEDQRKQLTQTEEKTVSLYTKEIGKYIQQHRYWTDVKNKLAQNSFNRQAHYKNYIEQHKKQQADYLQHKKPKKLSTKNDRKVLPYQIDGSSISNKNLPQAIADEHNKNKKNRQKPTSSVCTIS
jgi:hypothetical protein